MTGSKKIETILNWSRPKTVTDVRSFTGFTNYYHKYIKNYTKIACPLYELTLGKMQRRNNIMWTGPKGANSPSKNSKNAAVNVLF